MDLLYFIFQTVLFLLIIIGPLPLCIFYYPVINGKNRINGFSFNLLFLLITWSVIQTAIGLILGLTGIFNLKALTAFEALIFIPGFFYRNTIIKTIRDFRKSFIPDKYESGVLLFIILTGVTLLMKIISRPIGDSDSLAFHLTAMLQWIQSGTIVIPQKIPYPYNWEILCSLFILPFHSDFLVTIPNLAAWAIMGLSVYSICKLFGIKRIFCLTAAAFVLTIPDLLVSVNTIHIDLAFAAFFTAGVYFLLVYNETGNPDYLSLLLLIFSMTMGIKASGIPYNFILFLLFLFIIIKNVIIKKIKTENINKPLFVISCIIFPLTGLFWYIKNWVTTGNPLNFLALKVFGITIFRGIMDSGDLYKLTLAKSFRIFSMQDWKVIFIEIVKRLQLPIIISFIFSVSFIKSSFGKDKTLKEKSVIILILILATFGLYWNTPFSADNPVTKWIGAAFRYGFPFMSLLCVSAAIGLSNLKISKKIIILIIACCFILGAVNISILDTIKFDRSIILWVDKSLFLTDLLHNKTFLIRVVVNLTGILLPYLTVYIIVSIILLKMESIIKMLYTISMKSKYFLPAGIIILFIITVITGYFFKNYKNSLRQYVYGSTVKYIDDHSDRITKIGYLYSEIYYPLYGKNLNIRLLELPTNFQDLKSLAGWMNENRIQYISIGPIQGISNNVYQRANGKEIHLIEDNTNLFNKISGEIPDYSKIINKNIINETDYFSRRDNGRILYKLVDSN